MTKWGNVDACSVPTPTQSTCLQRKQNLPGLSLHGAATGSEKNPQARAKRMQTKHTQLKSAANRTSPLLSIMQSCKSSCEVKHKSAMVEGRWGGRWEEDRAGEKKREETEIE